jgi:hypothetical protein
MFFLGYNNGDIHYRVEFFELKNDLYVGSKTHFSLNKRTKIQFIVQ